LIGTYQRISFDDLSDRANAVIFGNQNTAGLVDRAPVAGKAALILWGGSVAVGATVGAGAYYGPAIVESAQIASRMEQAVAEAEINPRTYAQLEKQFAENRAKSIFKALRSSEKTLAEHIGKVDKLQYKSQVEGTIRNVAGNVKTIIKFIQDKGLTWK
jgi:hypothetical protein